MAEIAKLLKDGEDFIGEMETLAFHIHLLMKHCDKGADYSIYGPDGGELGAAWRRTGQYGAYLSVTLDCPSLAAPIYAIMGLTPDNDGFYVLRWQRRAENGRGRANNGHSDSRE